MQNQGKSSVMTGTTEVAACAGTGRIDPCSIELLEETAPAWTAAVLSELRHARYQPARREGQRVRQRVYQVFTYHQDGRRIRGR
jgi:hypothetical protein